MSQNDSTTFPEQVGEHYDRLAPVYLKLWGPSLHHGLWEQHSPLAIDGGPARLLDLLAAPLELNSGNRLIDIGCGYGTDAHRLAGKNHVHATGLTISRSQATTAAELPPPVHGSVDIIHGDWLQNNFACGSFDAALAIESLAHMPDKMAFFRELARTLVPGGRAALSCWTAVPDPSAVESLLLKYLCHTGALASIETLENYCQLANGAGLELVKRSDLTTRVKPTWTHLAWQSLASSRSPRFLSKALPLILRRPTLPGAIPAMLLAYHTGVLRYEAIWLRKMRPAA